MSTVHLLLLLLLLLVRSPVPLQAEHNIFDRGAGTSFSSATVNRGNKQVQMQVCITIGCCHHVCRQFSGESSSTTSVEQQQEPPELASFLQYASPPQQEDEVCQVLALEEQRNDNAAVVPRSLEFNQQALFSPSIKFLTILNTDNSSWIKILQATSTDKQFFIQALDEKSVIAPGESLTVAVVFLPRKTGIASGKILFQTSAGGLETLVIGEAVGNSHQATSLEDIEAVQGKLIQRTLSFYNPDEEAVEITELHVWPGDSHKKALCSPATDESSPTDKVSSCFANGFPSAILSKTKDEKYASQGMLVSLERLDDPWIIQSRQAADIARLDMTVSRAGAWDGHVYIRFSQSGGGKVMIFPLGLQVCPEDGTCEKESSVAATKVTKTAKQDNEAVASGSWVQTNDLMALRMAEALLKDLAHTLLRQRDIRKGGLAANQNEPTLIPGQVLSFEMVQIGVKEKMWINIVNPTQEPILINLILNTEAKSRNCKYRANWFWQGHKPQVHRDSSVFAFDAGAVTEAIVQGGGKLQLGPLSFRTRQKCDWTGLLFVKNNFTGLEWIPIRGKGSSAGLVFLDGGSAVKKLSMAVEVSAGTNSTSLSDEQICNARVHKNFQVKNTGSVVLEVRRIDLAEAPSITLGRQSGFSLAAGETIDMMVSYKHDYQHAGANKQVLKMVTSIGTIKAPVVATIRRELVSLCGPDPTFQEKVALPVSVCALVLVLGVFSWLLVQELPQQTTRSSPGAKDKQAWKHVARIRNLWKARVKVVAKNAGDDKSRERQDHGVPRPLGTRMQEDDKLHVKRKRKPKSTSSPHSSSSSPGPDSPHSSSESELRVPAIERILISSRFSEPTIPPRKAKPRVTLSSKVADKELSSKKPTAVDKEPDFHAAWEGKKLAVRIPSKEEPVDPPGRKTESEELRAAWEERKLAVRIPSNEPLESPGRATAKTRRSPAAKNKDGSSQEKTITTSKCESLPPAMPDERTVRLGTPPARTPGVLGQQLREAWRDDQATAAMFVASPASSTIPGSSSKQLSSIGQLRKAAIERTT
ncbi:transmembrane protein 131 homolog [Selaginella moellendorffii]|uniref:transmembrane protein 131 homolog n=1 Tax=Selaginella moellendorffii TaxID=88036 RepID=UPI000D1C9EC5|nr:transmembrane protein 131 homolog [Selaginella moellendorffii]XP_024521003.1 transmembrane protein 131 homolog [Selaginella moellendorffii]|eukprot:XP_024521002.1 transmembrane protein 131 homolog [Selaginella moellendorffii]